MLEKRDKQFNVGHMTKRIKLLTVVRIVDTAGGASLKTAEYKTIWANVYNTSDFYNYRMDMKMTADSKIFIIRYDSTINKEMKIDYNGREYYITNVNDFGNTGKYLKITAVGNEVE